jgi:hypothetical protein
MKTPDNNSVLEQINAYRAVVLEYEGLNDEIHQLIEAHDGSTEKMTQADVERYRTLARRRNEVLHERRWMERELFSEEDEDTDPIN